MVWLADACLAQTPAPSRPKLAPAEQCPTRADIDTIVEITRSKSQFESTEEFNRRLPLDIKKRLPALKTQNAFCVVVQVGRLRYDADKRVLKPFYLGDLMVHSETIPLGSYEARNAYGATAQVQRERSDWWRIQWIRNPRFSEIAFPMSPKDAEAQIADLKVGIVGDLIAPWGDRDRGTIRPTITSPREVEHDWRQVKMKTKRILLFNAKTQAVILDYTLVECNTYGSIETRVGGCKGL